MNKLHEAYTKIKEPEIINFLSSNSFLIDLMNDAVSYIEDLYGSGIELDLSLFSMSGDSDDDILFVNIITSIEPILAVDKLDEFLNIWFLDKMPDTKGKLSFDIKIVEE